MNKKMIAIVCGVVIAVLAAVGLIATQKDKEAAPVILASQEGTSAAGVEPAAAVADEKTPSAEDPIVARVDGQTILRSDVMEFMGALPPQMKQMPIETIFPMALEQVVNGKIVEEKAEKTDISNDPEVARRMIEAKEQISRAVFMEKEIEKNLSEARIKKAYDKLVAEQGKVEEIKARHILVENEAEAKDIIAKLAAGSKFEDLAKDHSKDTANKSSGGDLGYFTKDAMVPEFADATFKMKKGDITKAPIKTQFGYHVVEIEDRRVRPAPDYELVKPQIAANERREILNELIESWRKKASIETFDINGKPLESSSAPPADTSKVQ
jgi:peptidyl-prolyl cis-trans isomerase C